GSLHAPDAPRRLKPRRYLGGRAWDSPGGDPRWYLLRQARRESGRREYGCRGCKPPPRRSQGRPRAVPSWLRGSARPSVSSSAEEYTPSSDRRALGRVGRPQRWIQNRAEITTVTRRGYLPPHESLRREPGLYSL